MNKKELEAQLKSLQEDYDELDSDYSRLSSEYYAKCNELYKVQNPAEVRKRAYACSLSFDFWPPKDWLRLKVDKWTPGRYFQIYLGPLRFDFYED